MPVKSKAQEAYLAIHHPEVLRKWKQEGVRTKTTGLPGHVKKHATVADLAKSAEDRDNNVDDEGETRTNKDTDYQGSENFYGHGAGAKGKKKMNTVKDLLKKKAGDAGADLGSALQGVRDNAKKTMGAIKPTPASMPAPTPPPAKTASPDESVGSAGMDAGQDIANAIGKVKTDAAAKIKEEKAPKPKYPPPEVKMGPPIMPKTAGAAFTKMANRKDAMFFGKASGRNDGMFMKQAMEGEQNATVGDAMDSNPASGAVSGGMGHGKGVKGGAEKKGKAATATA